MFNYPTWLMGTFVDGDGPVLRTLHGRTRILLFYFFCTHQSVTQITINLNYTLFFVVLAYFVYFKNHSFARWIIGLIYFICDLVCIQYIVLFYWRSVQIFIGPIRARARAQAHSFWAINISRIRLSLWQFWHRVSTWIKLPRSRPTNSSSLSPREKNASAQKPIVCLDQQDSQSRKI